MVDKARQLREAFRALLLAQRTLNDMQRPCGTALPLPHAYALLELLHSDTQMTVTELAATLNIDRTNVSRLCARMESAGELTRRLSSGDGRARALELTEKGKALARHVDSASAEHFDRLLVRLGEDGDSILEALHRLTAVVGDL